MTRLPRFDVFRAGMIGGNPLGRYVATIGAPDHRTAREGLELMYGVGRVVVLPAGRGPAPTAAVTIRDDRRVPHHRTRP